MTDVITWCCRSCRCLGTEAKSLTVPMDTQTGEMISSYTRKPPLNGLMSVHSNSYADHNQIHGWSNVMLMMIKKNRGYGGYI